MSVSTQEFLNQYNKWEYAALGEYNAKTGENRTLIEDAPDDDTTNTVEFSENGDAYPHGIGGTNYVPNIVTPWKDSPYFVQ